MLATERNVTFFAGLDISTLLAAVAGIIFGAPTSLPGVGAVLFALGVAVLFVDILAPFVALGAAIAVDSRLALLHKETEEKKASCEALLEGAAQ